VSLREHLPTVATLGNVMAGFAACGFVVTDRPALAALMLLVGVLMDSLDGTLARSLRATSDLGAEMDSLADMVSFGVAPAILAGSLMPHEAFPASWLLISVYPLCAAWRLARFNASRHDSVDVSSEFLGLPSTGAGAAAATTVLVYLRLADANLLSGTLFLPFVMAALGALMVSRIAYKHAGAIIAGLNPILAGFLAALFIAGTVLWEYEFLFAGLMWSYVLYAPLLSARHLLHAARHA